MQAESECGNVWKPESHTVVYILLHSTTAVSLVSGLLRSFLQHARSREALRLQRLQEDN